MLLAKVIAPLIEGRAACSSGHSGQATQDSCQPLVLLVADCPCFDHPSHQKAHSGPGARDEDQSVRLLSKATATVILGRAFPPETPGGLQRKKRLKATGGRALSRSRFGRSTTRAPAFSALQSWSLSEEPGGAFRSPPQTPLRLGLAPDPSLPDGGGRRFYNVRILPFGAALPASPPPSGGAERTRIYQYGYTPTPPPQSF